jgi:hypothetical protein
MSDILSIDIELVDESNRLNNQEFQEEIENIDDITHQEKVEDNEYFHILGKYYHGVMLLNLHFNDSFVFRGSSPSPLGKTKEEMYEQTFKTPYHSKLFLYTSQQFEYYAYGQRFNKISRRWSFYPDHLDPLLVKISCIEQMIRTQEKEKQEN